MATQDYVKSLVKLHDKNENRMIDGDELEGLRRPASLADANNDKVITIDELNARLSQTTSSSSSSTSGTAKTSSSGDEDEDRGRASTSSWKDAQRSGSSSASSSKRVLTWMGGGKTAEDAKSKRRTYRFTPAGERLPTGLPSWFKSQDKNGDGQVSMSEYSRSWSRSTVSKFERYDVDGDGVVTAKEAKTLE
jgi:Ca2+-binding EF-hand superfamily protein